MVGPEALSIWDAIGSRARNFMLCRKPEEKKVEESNGRSDSTINGARKGALYLFLKHNHDCFFISMGSHGSLSNGFFNNGNGYSSTQGH
jgi:hypothetical protein